MKALTNSIGYRVPEGNVPFIITNKNINAKMVDFKRENQIYTITLGNLTLSYDNYRLFLNGHYLTLIISESKEAKRPLHLKNVEWDLYRQYKYEVMRNIDVWLPGDNFYLIKHFFVPESRELNIVLEERLLN